jgi:regulatory protein
MSSEIEDTTKLLKAALHYLKYRLRTRQEIEAYLARKYPQAGEPAIQTVIKLLEEQNVLNDRRFCLEWIHSQLNKGKGPIIIKYQLKKLGITSSLINQVIGDISDIQLITSVQTLLKRKQYRFNKLNNKIRKQKIKQYLYQRGFPFTIINTVIDEYRPEE